MKVIEEYEKHCCQNCDKWGYTYSIGSDDDDCGFQLRLCKDCLLKLLDAIIRR